MFPIVRCPTFAAPSVLRTQDRTFPFLAAGIDCRPRSGDLGPSGASGALLPKKGGIQCQDCRPPDVRDMDPHFADRGSHRTKTNDLILTAKNQRASLMGPKKKKVAGSWATSSVS